MAIQIETMDGGPDKIGHYLVNDPVHSWGYRPVTVWENEDGSLFAKNGAYELQEQEFERCIWSERLIAPEESPKQGDGHGVR